jgi:hypothetical protein
MPFLNYIHTLYDDICKIGMESSDAELRVVGKTFRTPCNLLVCGFLTDEEHFPSKSRGIASAGSLSITDSA